MNKEIEDLLSEEIRGELENLADIEQGSDEYKASIDGIVKLIDRSIEIEKVKSENAKQYDDIEFKLKQLQDENKDRLIRNGIAVAGIVVPTLITIWGTLKSFKFEETGTVTTILGRGFINKLLPKK